METQRARLDNDTRLFACGPYCATCLTRTVAEVHDWEPVHPGDNAIYACAHCAWCGSLLDPPPAFCLLHDYDCPELDPSQMVAVTLAARRYRDVLGTVPAARQVNRWVAQARRGITDISTLLGF